MSEDTIQDAQGSPEDYTALSAPAAETVAADPLGAQPDPNAAAPATVQGANGPVQVNTASPDFNQDPSVPDVPPSTPLWTRILVGALGALNTGLQGTPAGGRPSFLGGLGQGARANAVQQQQKLVNDQNQTKSGNNNLRKDRINNPVNPVYSPNDHEDGKSNRKQNGDPSQEITDDP